MSRPRIIEFTGHAGTGKSTLAIALLKQLEATPGSGPTLAMTGNAQGRGIWRFLASLVAAVRQPRATVAVTKAIWYARIAHPRALAQLGSLLIRRREIERLRKRADGPILVDDGPLHTMWSVFLTCNGRWSPRAVESILDSLGYLDTIVHCCCDVGVSTGRLNVRGAHRLNDLSSSTRRQVLTALGAMHQHTNSTADRRGIRVVSTDTTAVNSPDLAADVYSMLGID